MMGVRMRIKRVAVGMIIALMAGTMLAGPEQAAVAATATGKSAVRTQLQPQAKITGVAPLAWVPANTTLTLQCLAVGEKAWGAVAAANPYYYKTTYSGKTGYVSDSDLYTSRAATALGLPYCSLPSEPGSPAAGSVTSSTVKLSWLDNSNNETSFKTQYSTDGGKTWKAGPSSGANTTSITIGSLAGSTKYTFQVGASNNKGTKWSAYVVATTKAVSTVKNVGSGSCDYVKSGGNYIKSVGAGKVLGSYTLNNWKIAVCGPRPNFDGGSVGRAGRGINPYGGTPNVNDLDGYQCTELSARWLWYVHGAKLANPAGNYSGGNGRDVVNSYAAAFPGKFVKYSNAKTNRPAKGDVMSFNTSAAAGHVGIVYSVSIDGNGNGNVEVLEQNSDRSGGKLGKSLYSVSNWKIAGAINWLHAK